MYILGREKRGEIKTGFQKKKIYRENYLWIYCSSLMGPSFLLIVSQFPQKSQ